MEDLAAAVEAEALAAVAEVEAVLVGAVVAEEEAGIAAAVVVAEAGGTKDSAKQKDAGRQACVFSYWCIKLTQTLLGACEE